MFGAARDRGGCAVGTGTGNESGRVWCDWGLEILAFPDSGFLLSLTLLPSVFFDSVVVRLGPALFLPSRWTMSVVFSFIPENPDPGTVVSLQVHQGR